MKRAQKIDNYICKQCFISIIYISVYLLDSGFVTSKFDLNNRVISHDNTPFIMQPNVSKEQKNMYQMGNLKGYMKIKVIYSMNIHLISVTVWRLIKKKQK